MARNAGLVLALDFESKLMMPDPKDLVPWGDPAFEQSVRETAYFLWEQDGRPIGREQEYWYRALERAMRERDADRSLKNGLDQP